MYRIEQLNDCTKEELVTIAQKLHIENCEDAMKKDLVYRILDQQAATLKRPSLRFAPLQNKKNMRNGTKPRSNHAKDGTTTKR